MKHIFLFFCCATLLLLSGCANPSSQSNEAAEAEDTIDARGADTSAATAPALQTIADDAPRLANNAYDYTVLLPLFPEIIAGTGRQTTGGENYKLGAAPVGSANASYSLQDRRFSVSIHDAGDQTESLATLAKWSNFVIDEETETEIQRSTLIQNQPALFHYDKSRRSGSLSLVHKGRFVIDITGRNIDMAELEKALADLHIERLK